MSDRDPDSDEQTVPAEPSVHVERYPTHCMVTWKAGPLAQFVAATESLDDVSSTAPVVVEDTSSAGRERCPVTDIEASETVRYLRVEPDTPWTVSWERRTWPVVSVSGSLSPALCRRIHVRTTDCSGWPEDSFDRLVRALAEQ